MKSNARSVFSVISFTNIIPWSRRFKLRLLHKREKGTAIEMGCPVFGIR